MQLRWYQEAAVEAAWNTIRYGKCNPCIVVPTGGGKSWIIAELVRQTIEVWGGRVLVLQHRKELIEQNAEKIRALLPGVPVGIYSAGLKQKETCHEIVVAGIQSAYKQACAFDRRHIVIVDEAHLIPNSETTMYRTFLDELAAVNPGLRIIGLTATPYRTGEGLVTDGGVLDQICYEVPVRQLIAEGFLCELTSKPSEMKISMEAVHIRKGEYVQKEMEDTFLAGRRVQDACKEIVARCHDRRSVLIFTSGIAHAERVRETLETLTGERVDQVTGQTLPLERAATLDAFKEGRIRWLVNIDVLTTGFDATRIDAIAVLRATQSPGLFAQICGRGFRIDPSKKNCLILDFGGNVDRHGPLDSPMYGRSSGSMRDGKGEAPMRNCHECAERVPLGNHWCPFCGAMLREPEEQQEPKHEAVPDEASHILVEPEWQFVVEVSMNYHISKKEGRLPTLRVNYVVQAAENGGNLSEKTISEWICIDHDGYARQKAERWWAEHSHLECPTDIHECITAWKQGALRMPIKILAMQDGRWWRVLDREFETERPTEWHAELVEEEFDEAF